MNIRGRFICYQPNPTAEVNLICFPFAGGSAAVFHPWVAKLPSHVQLLAYQPPGRAQRMAEPSCMTMQEYMDDIWVGLEDYLDKPLVIFGHSMGALIAYEVARKLHLENEHVPVNAFFSAAKSPWKKNRAKFISHLNDDAFINELKRKGGFPEEVLNNKELMALCTPFIKSDYQLVEQYSSDETRQLAVHATVLAGVEDEITESELAEWKNGFVQPPEVHQFPGGHFFIQDDSVLNEMIALIIRSIRVIR
ncbi:thioesterase II family protein [Photobacterium galatheae]|uniref:Thioesterase domain-containing protein n=1 Tax=Photobacterium galatheae TaxID=1654360 RepID=A0A066RK30_9GAMM|nr:alpha/beta fold hydrolase [Photobacterium galatheae]KDM90790.1 hypothetical protein EA58_15505 [Photobacterium galatheae]MCM0149880.1 thioesterase [Photobacterium galatheae]